MKKLIITGIRILAGSVSAVVLLFGVLLGGFIINRGFANSLREPLGQLFFSTPAIILFVSAAVILVLSMIDFPKIGVKKICREDPGNPLCSS